MSPRETRGNSSLNTTGKSIGNSKAGMGNNTHLKENKKEKNRGSTPFLYFRINKIRFNYFLSLFVIVAALRLILKSFG